VTGVSPNQGYNYQPTTITITGSDFVATPTARLNNVPLTNVTFVDSTTLTAVVPADLPGGAYTLTVTNPDAQSASLVGAFTVLLSGDGTLSSWQVMSSMTTVRDAPASVRVGSYLYVLGGGNPASSNPFSSVERAAINSDDSLGAWQTTSSMITARSAFAAVSYGGYIYALGGYAGGNSVEFAAINNDGSLGAWQSTSAMTMAREGVAAVAANGYIYAIGGQVTASVERAAINPDGSLSPWQVTTSMNAQRQLLAAVLSGNNIYAIGGGSNGPPLASVEWATVNPDGSLGTWQTATSMTTPRCFHAATTTGGYIYALGGGNCGGVYYSSVERAKINTDGSLGSWGVVNSLSAPRWHLAAVQGRGYIYAIGGLDSIFFTALSSVERAAINPVSLTSLSPSVVPASQPTTITISGTNLLPTPTFQFGTITLTTSFVSTTTLTATIPSGLASGWYTATLTNGDGRVATLPNALRVDDTGPVAGGLTINGGALNSTSTNVTLTVSASDATDNAADLNMSFSNDGTAWSAWQSYSTKASWALTSGDGSKTVYGKFTDPAGNVSSVVSDTIDLDTTVVTDYGVTINDGALFTNQVTVTLKIGALPGTPRMMVSNDGGFAGAQWEPYASRRAWAITQYGSYVIPRTVYVRYGDVGGSVLNTSQDDIILDVTAPTGSVSIVGPTGKRARASTVTLALSATDDVSGVGSMMLSNRADFAGASWQAYATSATWTLDVNNTVYVRFRDNAGNVSQTYSARGQSNLFLPLVVR
jgi:hypothetical protein